MGAALLAKLGKWVPDSVEEHENDADLVPRRRLEELVHSREKACLVLLPEHVMQKNAHAVEAQAFGPAELAFDGW